MRPSHGVLPVDGYNESFRCDYRRSWHENLILNGCLYRQFNVPTFFARDIRNCRTFAERWYGKRLLNVESVCVKKGTRPPSCWHLAKLPPAIIYPLDYMFLTLRMRTASLPVTRVITGGKILNCILTNTSRFPAAYYRCSSPYPASLSSHVIMPTRFISSNNYCLWNT
jgi:hypothetical protein